MTGSSTLPVPTTPRKPADQRRGAPEHRVPAGAVGGAGEPPLRAVVLEAVRQLHDPMQLERLTPLVRLRAVQARAARNYADGWCATGRALRDVLRAAVEPVAEVLPADAAAMLRVLAEGGTAADAARGRGVDPAALRKRATPLIQEALARYLEHQETSGAP